MTMRSRRWGLSVDEDVEALGTGIHEKVKVVGTGVDEEVEALGTIDDEEVKAVGTLRHWVRGDEEDEVLESDDKEDDALGVRQQ